MPKRRKRSGSKPTNVRKTSLFRKIGAVLALPAFGTAMFWLEVPKKLHEMVATVLARPAVHFDATSVGITYGPLLNNLAIDIGLNVGNTGELGEQATFRTAKLHHPFAPQAENNQHYIPVDGGHFPGDQKSIELAKDRPSFPTQLFTSWYIGGLEKTAFPKPGEYRLELQFADSKNKNYKLAVCFSLTSGDVDLLQRGRFATTSLKPEISECDKTKG